MGGNSGRSVAGVAWPTMRALYEGAPATAQALADLSGRQVETVEAVAAKEQWRKGADTPTRRNARIAVLMDQMVGELEGIRQDRKTGRFDKARIETLAAMMRMLERVSEINESRQARQEEVRKSDAETAGVLRRIDERIVELARAFAREIIGDRVPDAAGDAAGRE